ncbi:hypothetical protein HY409_01675 [Candidatus Gottesmanbacteria bacterium]|nr:hypothetical protein [Candidatus Gottesmanbacteria bacterium]
MLLTIILLLFVPMDIARAAGASTAICQSIPGGPERSACESCVSGNGAYTALGCIDATGQGIFTKLFTTGIGIAGGIALLLILFGGLKILTSAGNPEHLTEGKETVWSAISGLLLIIFSVFLLQLIGFRILEIPGFQ